MISLLWINCAFYELIQIKQMKFDLDQ